MTELPPAAPRHRRRARLFAGLLAAAAAVAAVVTWTQLRDPDPPHHAAAPAPAPRPTAALPSTPPPTTASPTPRPTAPHDHVPAAVPTSFRLSGTGFTIRARVCAMPAVFPLDPPGEQHHTVCWVKKGLGVRPGTGTGTSYVLGHAWAEDAHEVLNKASEPATREILQGRPQPLDGVPVYPVHSLLGTRLTLRTPQGTLTYAVRQAYGVDKLKLGRIARVMNEHIRNRVVLITCAELHGVDYPYNVVLDARLVSSQRATPASGA